MNAFKNVKGKQSPTVKPSAPVATGPPPVLENNHQFQEYTYKNITPCDVCSQVMKGRYIRFLLGNSKYSRLVLVKSNYSRILLVDSNYSRLLLVNSNYSRLLLVIVTIIGYYW